MITRADVDDAARRTTGLTRVTPVVRADPAFPAEVWFKCEFMQHTGTFKARGALNRILASKERGELDSGVGVVVASGGNAGLANAYAAAQLGVPATVFVPVGAPAVKVGKLEAIGAAVVQGGAEYADAYQAAVEHARRIGDIGFSVAVRTGVESVLVADHHIVAARSALWNDYRLVVEHGAAAAYAAMTSGAYVPKPGERVAVILCGANTDPATL